MCQPLQDAQGRTTGILVFASDVTERVLARPAQVWLRAEPQPGQVVLSVRDNDLGLTDS